MFNRQSITGNNISNSVVVQNIGGVVVLPSLTFTTISINTLPGKNDYFEGRSNLVKKIDTLFKNKGKDKENKFIVLYGPGGIGKTSLAYRFASSMNVPVKIRIRMDDIDVTKSDFCQVANLLTINVEGKSLSEIADLVNSKLSQHYGKAGGVIVFDNVGSYDQPFNRLRSTSTGQALRKYFPKDGNFLFLITTRNKTYWPENSLVRISCLEPRESATLFQKVASSRQIDMLKLSPFLKDVLGGSPLAICQAASYLQLHQSTSLDEYMALYTESNSCISALTDSNALPPELSFDGETLKERRAIFSTYNINLEEIERVDKSFLDLLRHAALMCPDSLGKKELYTIFIQRNRSFNWDRFEVEVKKTSLLFFESDDEITMHRIIQFVLLLKASHSIELIRDMLFNLFDYFSKNFLKSRTAFGNFAYLLRNIVEHKIFYQSVDVSDNKVVEGLFTAAKKYIENNEVDEGILFLSDALQAVKVNSAPELFKKIMVEFKELLSRTYELININKKWLRMLLDKIDSEGRRAIVNILFDKEKALTSSDRYFEIPGYYESLKSLSEAIIEVYDNIPNKNEEDTTQLIRANYIIGRALREEAAGLKTQIQRTRHSLETINNEMKRLEVFQTEQRDKKKTKIRELRMKSQALGNEYNHFYNLSLEYLKRVIVLSKDAHRLNDFSLILAEIQLSRLDKLDKVSDPELNMFELGNHVVQNANKLKEELGGNYNQDILYCKNLQSSLNDLVLSQGFFSPEKKRKINKANKVEPLCISKSSDRTYIKK